MEPTDKSRTIDFFKSLGIIYEIENDKDGHSIVSITQTDLEDPVSFQFHNNEYIGINTRQ